MYIKQAFAVLSALLRDDKGYAYGWQANIAVSFQDLADKYAPDMDKAVIHEWSNEAAKNFIKLLTYLKEEGATK